MRDVVNGSIYKTAKEIKASKRGFTEKGWSLHIKDQSWVEDTENQVDFIIKTLELSGHERILDLGCGFGRHSLSFARKGFSVVGVDITKEYIDDAVQSARNESLDIEFMLSDIRDIKYKNEFDVVLNLADGAIGYFDSDEENLRAFDIISQALKTGGKHFLDTCNAEHAEQHFPKRHWQIGSKILSLPEFDWDKERRRMIYGGWEIVFGEIAQRAFPVAIAGSHRLYSLDELNVILNERDMRIIHTFSDYYGKAVTHKEMQLMVYSIKE